MAILNHYEPARPAAASKMPDDPALWAKIVAEAVWPPLPEAINRAMLGLLS